MSLLAVPIIAVVALVIGLLCLFGVYYLSIRHKAQVAMFTSQYQAQELILNNLQRENEQLHLEVDKLSKQDEKIVIETREVSKQLEHRIKTLQTQANNQQDNISQLQTAQGDDKFYSRAIKLAKKGADIEEIVTECELPHAEVETLISVYQKKNHS